MADLQKSQTELQTLLADNNSQNISPQDIRDWLVSCHLKMCTTTAVNYSATSNDMAIILDASSSAISLTLPTCTAGNIGQIYDIKAINNLTNRPYISNNIDGAIHTFISNNESIIIGSDGTNWKKFGKNINTQNYMCTTTAVNYSATANDMAIILDASNSAVTLNLPTSTAGSIGKTYMIKAINNLTNKPTVNVSIDGVNPYTMASFWEGMTLVDNGTLYRRVSTTERAKYATAVLAVTNCAPSASTLTSLGNFSNAFQSAPSIVIVSNNFSGSSITGMTLNISLAILTVTASQVQCRVYNNNAAVTSTQFNVNVLAYGI
jgi:hypothetical protein